jgi:hypothetical protein
MQHRGVAGMRITAIICRLLDRLDDLLVGDCAKDLVARSNLSLQHERPHGLDFLSHVHLRTQRHHARPLPSCLASPECLLPPSALPRIRGCSTDRWADTDSEGTMLGVVVVGKG